MISKKLLSAILDVNCTLIEELLDSDNTLRFETNNVNFPHEINIYELAHKCKEWAFELNYSISSCKRIDGSNHKFFEAWVQRFTYQTEETEHDYSEHLSYCVGDIEPEAVFNVCDYILRNKEQK